MRVVNTVLNIYYFRYPSIALICMDHPRDTAVILCYTDGFRFDSRVGRYLNNKFRLINSVSGCSYYYLCVIHAYKITTIGRKSCYITISLENVLSAGISVFLLFCGVNVKCHPKILKKGELSSTSVSLDLVKAESDL